MHVRLLTVLTAAVSLMLHLNPASARAAVAVHTYQITAGSGVGTLAVGSITGGQFSVQFASTPCGPLPATCPATILAGYVAGSTGMLTFTPTAISSFNAGQVGSASHTGNQREAQWQRLNPANTLYETIITFDAVFSAGNPSFQGGIFMFKFVGGVTGILLVGEMHTQGQEVGHAVPEPAPVALMATGAIILCAYVFGVVPSAVELQEVAAPGQGS